MSSYDDILGKKPLQKGLANDQPDIPPTPAVQTQKPATATQQPAATAQPSNVVTQQPTQPVQSTEVQKSDAPVYRTSEAKVVNAVPDSSTIPGYTAPAAQASASDEQPKRRYLTYDDIEGELKRQDEIMRRNAPETEEERAAREKREKRNKMFSALGDGISALSNLFFTTKGAPNMYNPQTSMSEATRKRMEMARAARDKEREAYNAAATRRYAILNDADNKAYKWDALARQQRLDADEKARKDALLQAQAGKYRAAQSKDEAMTAYYDKKVDLLERGFSADQAEKMARIAKLEAEADKARRQGTSSWVGGSKGGSGSGSGKYSLFNEQTGRTETFATKGEWLRRAGELGYDTGTASSSHSESDDGYGTKKQTDTSRRSNAAEANIGRQEAARRQRYNAAKHAAAGKPAQQSKQKSPSKAQTQRSANNKYANVRKLGL